MTMNVSTSVRLRDELKKHQHGGNVSFWFPADIPSGRWNICVYHAQYSRLLQQCRSLNAPTMSSQINFCARESRHNVKTASKSIMLANFAWLNVKSRRLLRFSRVCHATEVKLKTVVLFIDEIDTRLVQGFEKWGRKCNSCYTWFNDANAKRAK